MIKVFTYNETNRPGKTVEMTVHDTLGQLMGYIHVPWSSPIQGRRLSVCADGDPIVGLHDDDVESDSRVTFTGSPEEMQPLLTAVGAFILMYGLMSRDTEGGIAFVDKEYVLPLIGGADIVAIATMYGLGYDFKTAFDLGGRMTKHRAMDVIAVHDLAVDTGKSFTEVLALL